MTSGTPLTIHSKTYLSLVKNNVNHKWYKSLMILFYFFWVIFGSVDLFWKLWTSQKTILSETGFTILNFKWHILKFQWFCKSEHVKSWVTIQKFFPHNEHNSIELCKEKTFRAWIWICRPHKILQCPIQNAISATGKRALVWHHSVVMASFQQTKGQGKLRVTTVPRSNILMSSINLIVLHTLHQSSHSHLISLQN